MCGFKKQARARHVDGVPEPGFCKLSADHRVSDFSNHRITRFSSTLTAWSWRREAQQHAGSVIYTAVEEFRENDCRAGRSEFCASSSLVSTQANPVNPQINLGGQVENEKVPQAACHRSAGSSVATSWSLAVMALHPLGRTS
jgi:hypothetical protein